MDLYYDPIVDEHVGQGTAGISAPTWYFAPQKREVAQAGWETTARLCGALGDGPIRGMEDPRRAVNLLQFAGEFADPEAKQRIWQAADPHIQPTWDTESGEFTLGFGLNEAHPRGQWNARAMAGWVCTQGAWASIFNAPKLGKFDEPTVEGVDFPKIALSQARWDGTKLHLAVHPQNKRAANTPTEVTITNLDNVADWVLVKPNGATEYLAATDGRLTVELLADNQTVTLQPATA